MTTGNQAFNKERHARSFVIRQMPSPLFHMYRRNALLDTLRGVVFMFDDDNDYQIRVDIEREPGEEPIVDQWFLDGSIWRFKGSLQGDKPIKSPFDDVGAVETERTREHGSDQRGN
jgi:hypothetical protein